jgi:hypothetical protein
MGGTRLRRLGVAALFAVAALGLTGQGASAVEPLEPAFNRQVTGPFTGTQRFAFGENGCSFVFQVFHATYRSAAGAGLVHTEGCIDIDAGTYKGTFTITAPAGGTLRGTVDGTFDPLADVAVFDLDLIAARSSGSLAGAVGKVRAVVRWDGFPARTIEGSLTGQLRRATPRLSVSDARVVEGDAGLTRMVFTVRIPLAHPRPVGVRFIVADGSASRLQDYVFKQGSLTFQPGETSKQVGVELRGDLRHEPDETLFLVLFEPTGGVIADSSGVGVIVNDD